MSDTPQIQVLPSKKHTSVCLRTETSPLYASLYLFPDEALRVGSEMIQTAVQILATKNIQNSSIDLIDVGALLTTLSIQLKQIENRREGKKA